MTTGPCKECGKEVSTKADTCPHCGARQPKTGALTKLVAGTLAFIALAAIVSSISGPATPVTTPPEDPVIAAKKAADLKRYAAAVGAADALKKNLRDPESLRIDSMRVNDDATVVCTEYRAKNGFGGMNRAIAGFVKGSGFTDAASWNKHCRGVMTDQLYAVQ